MYLHDSALCIQLSIKLIVIAFQRTAMQFDFGLQFTFGYNSLVLHDPAPNAIKCDHQIPFNFIIICNIKNTNFFFLFKKSFTRIFQGFCEHVIWNYVMN